MLHRLQFAKTFGRQKAAKGDAIRSEIHGFLVILCL